MPTIIPFCSVVRILWVVFEGDIGDGWFLVCTSTDFNFSAMYINKIFIESFLTPNCLFNFRWPKIIQLAQAITCHFLVCIKTQFPSKKLQLNCSLPAK
ncbi:uncharacterized protein VP01_474g2 [Puccinia sorghi]|uniref:Uncharacterized protein n=1 Tax=Puccinia sorghi TaxID=27349 RepID=A0A0L6UMV2_9BASI|nr:uncharacterized protein VP01_474g2 [Puccinia sorghi]